jgi:enoyl-CoA hydratase
MGVFRELPRVVLPIGLGLRLTKECLNASIDAASLEAAIAMEDRNQILCARTQDFAEGIRAFLEKRPPVYRDG